MPRFSLKQTLVSTTLIAAGIAYYGYLKAHSDEPFLLGMEIAVLFWLASGAAIGVGIFGLFRRPFLGACIGALGAFVVLFYLAWSSSYFLRQ